MVKFLEKLIFLIKKKEFKLDDSISASDFLMICFLRILMIVRGFFQCVFRVKFNRLIFTGKKVTLLHKKHMTFGQSVTLNNYVEINALSKNGVVLGNNVSIGAYSKIQCTGSLSKLGVGLEIGSNSGVGEFSYFGAAGGIKIGCNVIMGQNVRFHSENHIYNRIDIPIREQGVYSKGIIVEDDCWVGAGSVFLDGVTVGKGSVIAANSVVNKDVPPYSVVAGIPAKVIKNRK
ncbi:DapH/DapD/GlmU-related protein [Priestia sp. TSO9]|uniref:acyltransferase n=1 Tax=Priestia sp. TSO9 TaxID=2885632 RepID=UPI0027E39D27|nr:DapH/DapD/GlmU-related protein [Priestia sp. TSO9]